VYCSRVKSDVLQLWQRRDTRLAGRGIEVLEERAETDRPRPRQREFAWSRGLGACAEVERFGCEPNGGVDNKHYSNTSTDMAECLHVRI
jgi:hypothetical protein